MGADQHINFQAHVASALEWWHDAGVDCQVDDAPYDWLTPAPVAGAPMAARAVPDSVPDSVPDIVPDMLPDTLAEFVAWRMGADMPEAAWPGHALPAQGDAASGLMILVDMPDREDEAGGALLSGAAGRLFDRMLAAIGRDRHSIYLTALAVKRPPSARLTPDIVQSLEVLLRHHVALAAPKRLLVLGNAVSRAIIGTDVADARGVYHNNRFEGGMTETATEIVASFHPRFLIERPVAKADAWKDLQLLIKGL